MTDFKKTLIENELKLQKGITVHSRAAYNDARRDEGTDPDNADAALDALMNRDSDARSKVRLLTLILATTDCDNEVQARKEAQKFAGNMDVRLLSELQDMRLLPDWLYTDIEILSVTP